MRRLLLALALLATGCSREFSDSLDKGAEAYRHNALPEAAQHFEKAVALKPDSVEARRQLALAYARQYAAGVTSPENLALAQKAEASFRKVLDLAPGDKAALASLGELMYEESIGPLNRQGQFAKLDEAKTWIEKLKAVDPRNSEAFYFLGVIDWTKANPQLAEARQQLHMGAEDPGPLQDEKVRRDLQTRIGPLYDDAIQQLTGALKIDTDYGDAMVYLNLCLRGKADLAAGKNEYDRDVKEAQGLVDKALFSKTLGHQNHRQSGSSVFLSLPPPPPPPPPPAPPPA